MRSATRLRERGRREPDAGRAIIEFVFLGTLLLLPLIYLVMTLAQLQAASYAVATAAREAGRAFMTADSDAAAFSRADAAADLSFEDFGFAGTSSLSVTCQTTPCLRADADVRFEATVTVGLPFVPDFMTASLPGSMPVRGTHVLTIDRFRAG